MIYTGQFQQHAREPMRCGHEQPSVEPLSSALVRLLFMTLSGTFAILTVLTHIAQAFNIPFAWYARAGLVVALCAFAVAGFTLYSGIRTHQKDACSICLLVALAALGAVFALIAHKPNPDD